MFGKFELVVVIVTNRPWQQLLSPFVDRKSPLSFVNFLCSGLSWVSLWCNSSGNNGGREQQVEVGNNCLCPLSGLDRYISCILFLLFVCWFSNLFAKRNYFRLWTKWDDEVENMRIATHGNDKQNYISLCCDPTSRCSPVYSCCRAI